MIGQFNSYRQQLGSVSSDTESVKQDPRHEITLTSNYSVILLSFTQTLGEQKVAAMTECKDFKKGIHQLEWEHRRMMMQMDDLNNKARHIQMLKLAKDLQLVSVYKSFTSGLLCVRHPTKIGFCSVWLKAMALGMQKGPIWLLLEMIRRLHLICPNGRETLVWALPSEATSPH